MTEEFEEVPSFGSYPQSSIQDELFYVSSVGRTTRRDPPSQPKPKPAENEDGTEMSPEDVLALQQKLEAERKMQLDRYLLDAVKELVKEGAKLNVSDDQGMTPVHHLAMFGAPETLDWCIQQGAKIKVKGMNGGTPLFWAASCRESECVKVLAKNGASPNTQNSEGVSALHTAAVKMRHLETVKALVSSGATITEDIILQACHKPSNPSARNIELSLELLRYLLTEVKNISFNAFNEEGETALSHTYKDWKEAFKLIWKIAYPSKFPTQLPKNNKTDESFLRLLCKICNPDKELELFQQVLALSAGDLQEKDKQGRNLLHEAKEKPEFVILLVKAGININNQDNIGSTFLHELAEDREDPDTRARLVKILFSNNVDRSIQNNVGKTAFELLNEDFPADKLLKELWIRENVELDAKDIQQLEIETVKKKIETEGISSANVKVHTSPLPSPFVARKANANAGLPNARTLMKGFLTKEGSVVSNWKKRWFVLTEEELIYYVDDGGLEKGYIPLASITGDCYITTGKKISTPQGGVPLPNCIKIHLKDRSFYAYASTSEESNEWIDAINSARNRYNEEKEQLIAEMKDDKTPHPNFTGTWKLDMHKSDSVDNLLKALGRSWVDRKVASNTPMVVSLTQTATEVRMQTSLKSMKGATKKVSDKVFGGKEIMFKVDILSLTGIIEIKSEDSLASGKVRQRTVWNNDGKQLITKAEVSTSGGVGDLTVTRYLEDGGNKLIFAYELTLPNGASVPTVKRCFKKKS